VVRSCSGECGHCVSRGAVRAEAVRLLGEHGLVLRPVLPIREERQRQRRDGQFMADGVQVSLVVPPVHTIGVHTRGVNTRGVTG
jgi:hypothetical protein